MNKTTSLLAALLLLTGCAWESGGSTGDAGEPDAQQTDAGGDVQLVYPPPPYGTAYGETAENIQVERCICDGDEPQGGEALELADYLGAKAVLITVHAGWCTYCKQQSASMQHDLYEPYHDRGLEIMLVLFQDDRRREDRDLLLDYCCYYKDHYHMAFDVVIDPGAAATGQFFRPDEAGTPLNMLLDDEMVIRYKVEGLIPDSHIIEGNIEGLLGE
ncbi:MAG: redoxin domain-containing protein [Deltaproteobacteria bacterium]|nr:redoxin domain-containing protein [Deltaproteobacteria bacterium]